MRLFFISLATVAALVAALPPDASLDPLPLIDQFNHSVQRRLLNPAPAALGMSRVMIRPSFGHHFLPVVSDQRDFEPETDQERDTVAELERRRLQLGLYLFGESILRDGPELLSFRALKGPGAITAGTPRAGWYPTLLVMKETSSDRLPDWNHIYPVAQRAMRSFVDSGRGFETKVDSWTIAARPALASHERCIGCHNNSAYRPARQLQLGDPVGGLLYAYRMTP